MESYQETKFQKLKKFVKECRRVIRVTKKPNKEEYKTIVKVSALGMAIIGSIGFVIAMIKQILF